LESGITFFMARKGSEGIKRIVRPVHIKRPKASEKQDRRRAKWREKKGGVMTFLANRSGLDQHWEKKEASKTTAPQKEKKNNKGRKRERIFVRRGVGRQGFDRAKKRVGGKNEKQRGVSTCRKNSDKKKGMRTRPVGSYGDQSAKIRGITQKNPGKRSPRLRWSIERGKKG